MFIKVDSKKNIISLPVHFRTLRAGRPAKLRMLMPNKLVGFIRRFRTPVWSVNAPTALKVECNGKGGTVLFFPLKRCNMVCDILRYSLTFKGGRGDIGLKWLVGNEIFYRTFQSLCKSIQIVQIVFFIITPGLDNGNKARRIAGSRSQVYLRHVKFHSFGTNLVNYKTLNISQFQDKLNLCK